MLWSMPSDFCAAYVVAPRPLVFIPTDPLPSCLRHIHWMDHGAVASAAACRCPGFGLCWSYAAARDGFCKHQIMSSKTKGNAIPYWNCVVTLTMFLLLGNHAAWRICTVELGASLGVGRLGDGVCVNEIEKQKKTKHDTMDGASKM